MNALVDKACIQALYTASQAGVKIDLQVRGICCLRPGIPGSVRPSRSPRSSSARLAYYFRNGGEEEVARYLMPRNLDRRVEVLFPVDDPRLRQIIVQDVLHIHFQDNVQARRLRPDGSYERLSPPPNTEGISAQDGCCNIGKPAVSRLPVQPRSTRPKRADTRWLSACARDSHDSRAGATHAQRQ